MPTTDPTSSILAIKGPQWLIVGVLIIFGTLQLLRVLSLPETFFGITLRSVIEVLGSYAAISLGVGRMPFWRFVTIAWPLIMLGHFAVDPVVRGNDDATFYVALLFAFGLGWTVATYWLRWRLKRHKSAQS